MRVAIANRGEVALRIIRACQELGHTSILLHSTPDKNTPAFRLADEVVEIEGATPLETYLDIKKIIDAARFGGAEMLHPGFGFLSENADFVRKIEESGIRFVGPTSDTIRMAGNKVKAKQLAQKAGVPVVPSYTGQEADPKILLNEVRKIGFPVIIKAASGGGGKGMKVVTKDEEFFEQLASAQREAKNAFASDVVFIEKYLENPRHIEVQILGDIFDHRLHFYERECSIQRRHQKIFEEAPSASLDSNLRTEITSAALAIAKEARYSSAGTVEFLLDDKKHFYFMELNTRLQVEHTVTEMTCGVDFLHLQFQIAKGEPLSLKQDQFVPYGHALEVRVYAENPAQGFLPSVGKIERLRLPIGPFRRFDFGYDEGDSVTPYYDPMIGKIITWAPTREENIQRMLATLSETVIFGVHTNIELLKAVLKNQNYRDNRVSTRFLGREFGEFKLPPLTPKQRELAAQVSKSAIPSAAPSSSSSSSGQPARGLLYTSPWRNS